MSKEYQCIVDAAKIVGFNMPAMMAGTHADIQSFPQQGETVAKGTYLGTDGMQHEMVAREVPSSIPGASPQYFAGTNVRNSAGGLVRSSDSMINNNAALQKLISCIPTG